MHIAREPIERPLWSTPVRWRQKRREDIEQRGEEQVNVGGAIHHANALRLLVKAGESGAHVCTREEKDAPMAP